MRIGSGHLPTIPAVNTGPTGTPTYEIVVDSDPYLILIPLGHWIQILDLDSESGPGFGSVKGRYSLQIKLLPPSTRVRYGNSLYHY
jgi:hypothetical protein